MKNQILIALLFISFGAFAQSKFIEVEVTDTITLKPLSYRCNFYVDTYDYNDDVVVEVVDTDYTDVDTMAVNAEPYVPYNVAVQREKGRQKVAELTKMLEAKKFKVNPLDESYLDIMDQRGYEKEGFTVIVNSLADMESLKVALEDRQDVTPAISVLKYEDAQKAEEVLIKKLITRAKARAQVIGASSGLKPGRIIEVKEGKKSNEMSVSELYAQILKMGSYGKGLDVDPKIISKTFVVKFVAE